MQTRKLKIVLVMICAALVFTAALVTTESSAQKTPPAQQPAAAPAEKDYSKFLHKDHEGQVKIPGTNQTKTLNCAYCHERNPDLTVAQAQVANTKRNQRLQLKFPGHKTCTDCHIQQFTKQPLKTCTICHDSAQALNTSPPQRDYPKRYDFNAFFDAKQHEEHMKYKMPDGKETSCVFCHKPRSKPFALGIAVHNECFVCHTPKSGDEKASKKSDCAVCHTQMTDSPAYFSALYTSRAWGAQFTHKQHADDYKIACAQCHTVSGGYNQPVPTSIKTKAHLTPGERSGRGCFSCHDGGNHNGRTVFSGEDFNACDRCHKQADKKVVAFPG